MVTVNLETTAKLQVLQHQDEKAIAEACEPLLEAIGNLNGAGLTEEAVKGRDLRQRLLLPIPDILGGAEAAEMLSCDMEASGQHECSEVLSALSERLKQIDADTITLRWDVAERIRRDAIKDIKKVLRKRRPSQVMPPRALWRTSNALRPTPNALPPTPYALRPMPYVLRRTPYPLRPLRWS